MKKRSIWAVVAGVLFIIVVTTLVDVVLHVTHVFPPMNQPINDALALLATSYRIVISVGGAWLTARLAPEEPMKHAMILGYVGTVLGLANLEPGARAQVVPNLARRAGDTAMLGWRQDLRAAIERSHRCGVNSSRS